MHYHAEIIIPPTADVEDAVRRAMAPFCEHPGRDEDDPAYDLLEDDRYGPAFWDYYQIGGRWAGAKLKHRLGQDRVGRFYDWLTAEGITVSSLQWGKPELEPASQMRKVQAEWDRRFPGTGPCPLFKNFDPHEAGTANDVAPLRDVRGLTAVRVIIVGPSGVYDREANEHRGWTGPLEPVFVMCEDFWTGCNHVKTTWDRTVGHAVEMFRKDLERMAEGYRETHEPGDDWLTVTVDYHS